MKEGKTSLENRQRQMLEEMFERKELNIITALETLEQIRKDKKEISNYQTPDFEAEAQTLIEAYMIQQGLSSEIWVNLNKERQKAEDSFRIDCKDLYQDDKTTLER